MKIPPSGPRRLCVIVAVACALAAAGGAEARPPNVLFIAVDDLRPELGCHGQTEIRSPHIDDESDADERVNLANRPEAREITERLSAEFRRHRSRIPAAGRGR